MYQIHMTQSATLTFSGVPVDPTTPIDLTSGWNWISYLPTCDLAINVALESLNGLSDFIKNQTQFSSYVEGFGWFGSLTTMTPFDGFKVHMLQAGTLVYPSCDVVAAENGDDIENNEAVTELIRNNIEWNINPHDFEFNGSIIASVEIDGIDSGSEADYLAVYVGDECRGIATGMTHPLSGKMVYPMMVFSNEESETVTFRYYQESSQMVFGFGNSVEFTANMVSNELILTDSYDFTRGPIPTEYALSAAYPNPFNPMTNMNYALVNDGNVSITVYDITGRVVQVLVNEYQTAGNYQIAWNAVNSPSGLYLIRMESSSFVEVQKVMLVK